VTEDDVVEAAHRKFLALITSERRETQAKTRKRESTRRMWSFDRLPMPRAFMRGPKWRRLFDVKEIPIAEIDPVAAELHRPGRKLLVFTLEDDVRELLFTDVPELRPGVYAMW
jgi:hypothetical protein